MPNLLLLDYDETYLVQFHRDELRSRIRILSLDGIGQLLALLATNKLLDAVQSRFSNIKQSFLSQKCLMRRDDDIRTGDQTRQNGVLNVLSGFVFEEIFLFA